MEEILKVVPVPVIVGLVQIFKKNGAKSNLLPVIAIILGLLASFGFSLSTGNVINYYDTIMLGITYGLSAVGLYSGTKNTVATGTSDADNEA